MDITFQWEQRYEIGNKLIDSQHRNLFDITNTVAHAKDQETLELQVLRLIEYTKIHFDDEEKLMAKVHYPDIDKHCELHNQLILQLHQYEQIELNAPETVEEFQYFVFEWLINHILYYDMDFFNYYDKYHK